MHKVKLIILAIVIVVILAIIAFVAVNVYPRVLSPSTLMVTSIDPTDKQITVTVASLSGAINLTGYKTSYNAGILYIQVKGNYWINPIGDAIYNIPNKYGKIDKIVLQDSSPAGNVEIWPKN